MADKKFAFESGKVAVAFTVNANLGDVIISKKILTAFIELAPDCVVDLLCVNDSHRIFSKAFFSDIDNLNLTMYRNEQTVNNIKSYDLAFILAGSYAVILEHANLPRLQKIAPELAQAVVKIIEYNKANVYDVGSAGAVSIRNMVISRILRKNCYKMLSCDGALPIHDDKIHIPLSAEYKPAFDALKLGNYITIYSDIERTAKRPKIKTWPMRYQVEFISLMKRHRPDIQVVQCGGGGIQRLRTSTVISWASTLNLRNTSWRTAFCMSVPKAD